MIEPEPPRRGVMIKSKCHDINPEATQRRMARIPGPIDKIEAHRYAEEDDKSWQDAESSFQVKSAKVLANRQRFHFQKTVGNEKTREGKKDPEPNPSKKDVVVRINEVIGENQGQTDATQSIERHQMSLAGVHRALLKRTVGGCIVHRSRLRAESTMV